MPTIPERLETATSSVEASAATLSTALTTATTAATSASTSATTATSEATIATTQAGIASTAATAAASSEANALTYKNAAGASATAAGTSQTAAAASQTAAGTSATAAAGSATTATTQAGNASTSAASASASATAAQNAVGNFAGLSAGNAVPNTPTPATAGKYFIISSAGTSQGKTWAFGDWAVYKGTSGQYEQLTSGQVDATVLANRTNALAPRQGLVFDGSSLATVVGVGAFGLADFTIALTASAAALGPNGHYLIWDSNNTGGPVILYDATGLISIGSSTLGTVGTGVYLLINRATNIAWVRQSGVSYFYLDGVQVFTTADSKDYSKPLSRIGSGAGYSHVGYVGELYVENRSLSAAEVLALYQSGAPASTDRNNATNTSLITGADSDFSSNTGFWNQLSGGNNISGGVANLLDGQYFGTSSPIITGAFRAGSSYRISGAVTFTGAGVLAVYDGAAYIPITGSAGSFTFEVTQVISAGWLLFRISGSGGTLDNITLTPLGLLCAPEANAPGNGLVWNDTSGNGAHIVLPISGVAWALPSNGSNRVRGTTNTNGNQQLLGSYVFNSGLQILRIRARARSGTPTVKYGSSSGAGDIVAAVALSSSWQLLTLANAIITGNNVNAWVQSNTTDVVETDITVEPVSF